MDRLTVVAVAVFLVGMLWLFILSFSAPPVVKLHDLATTEFEDVKVVGSVESLRPIENGAIATISATEKVNVVFFDPRLIPKEGDRIIVTGTRSFYQGKVEVIAESQKQVGT